MVCLFRSTRRLGAPVAGLLLVASANGALAAEEAVSGMDGMQQQLDVQTRQIELMKRELQRQETALAELRRELDLNRRGRGDTPPPAAVAQAAAAPESPRPVGQAPAARERPPEVAPIFEQPGVLTPPGKWIVEPSLQYSYSSSDRITLVGYTVIPAILIGLIDVRNVKSNSLTATLAVRRGITNRFELEARVPYVYRFDNTQSREIFTGTATDSSFDQNGQGIGDVELIGRYQLNDGGGDSPYYIASMRFKTRTGKDPYEVKTSYLVDGAATSRVALQQELPTGSGFYSFTPGLTVLIPSDPAVFFGGVSYQYSIARDDVQPNVSGAPPELAKYKEIRPGGVFGFNFGMGLALNERSSFSIGYDHLSVGKTEATFAATGNKATGVRVQLGSLLLGYSYKLNSKQTLNLSLGVGVTRDTPDMQLTLRMPLSL